MTRLVLFGVMVVGTVASAADPVVRARELYKQARQRYEAKDYAGAAALFQQSHELSKAPGLLFNLGQALRNLGECGRARAAYREYLDKSPKAPNAAEVNELIAAMERCEREQQQRIERPEEAPPPPVTDPGPPVPAESGLMALPSVPASPPSPWLTVSAVALDVLAVAALGAGVGFSVSARSASLHLEEAWAGRVTWTRELAAVEQAGRRDSFVGAVLLSAGAALAVAGLVTTIVRLVAGPSSDGALAWSGVSF